MKNKIEKEVVVGWANKIPHPVQGYDHEAGGYLISRKTARRINSANMGESFAATVLDEETNRKNRVLIVIGSRYQ